MKKGLAYLALLAVFIFVPLSVRGAEESGSLRIRMQYEDRAVSGGVVSLYYVGQWTHEGFSFAGPFAKCGLDVEDLQPETAAALAAFASERDIPGQSQTVGDSGTVLFTDLEEGLYLAVQSDAAPGYLPMNPFLIQMPQEVNGSNIHHIEARPKLTPEDSPKDPQLPQTGQLKWPVPVLLAGGAVLLILGCFGGRKKGENGK